MITEIASITIAVLSLILSLYVIARERNEKKLDHLYNCRQRILDIFYEHETLTVDQMIEYFETDPDSDEAQKHKAVSQETTSRVDKEFEFACYLVLKKQIDINSFFDIFKGYIIGRRLMWKEYKKKNHPYTWKLICLCEKKGLIPLKKKEVDDA